MNTPGRITQPGDEFGDDTVARIATHLRQADYREPPETEIFAIPAPADRGVSIDDLYEDNVEPEGSLVRGRLGVTAGLLVLAAGWVGFVLWMAASRATLVEALPVLATLAAGITPPLLIVLIWIVATRRPEDSVGKVRAYAQAFSEEAGDALRQLSEAEARLGDAYAAMGQQSREAAAIADAGVHTLRAASSQIEELCARVDAVLKASGARANDVLVRIGALETAAPRMDECLSTFAGTLAQSCDDIAARSAALDEQIRTAAIIAEEARLQLIEAHDATTTKADVLRHETRQLGDELTKLSELASARVDLTLERTRAAVAETHRQIDCNNAALESLTERSRTAIHALGAESTTALAERVDEVLAYLSTAEAAMVAHGRNGAALFQSLENAVDVLAEKFAAIEGHAETGGRRIGEALAIFAAEAAQLETSLCRGNDAAEQFVKQAESLLVALDADIREINESLPAAFDRVDTRVISTRDRLEETMAMVARMQGDAEAILGRLTQTKDAVAAQAAAIDTALGAGDNGLARQTAHIETMRQALTHNRALLIQLNEEAAPQVLHTLEQVRETADAAATHARQTIETAISSAASQLEQASGAALEAAVGRKVNDQLQQIAEIADNAVKSADRATDHLMRQMMALTDSAAELEGRIAKAAQADSGLSRDFVADRSAQIIASLQDNAIDVAKWLDQDVSERDWAAYLNGDKSLFTRRAVRLLSSSDMRKLHAHYRDDPLFQEQVNRYVAAFEAMLRDILAGRNGNNLAIALLSSDVGKLYVALAQGIERLRVG